MYAEECPECGAWMDYHLEARLTWVDPNPNDPGDTGESQEQVHKWVCPECGYEMEVDEVYDGEDDIDEDDDEEYPWEDKPIVVNGDEENEK